MRLHPILIAFSIFAASLSAFGQASATAPESMMCANPPTKYIIQGRIIAPGVKWDSYNEVLQLFETQLMGVGYTRSDGEYSLPEQPAGRYNIVVRIDGFQEYKGRVDIDGCDKYYTHFIYLEPELEQVRIPVLDFTGEVNEVVDIEDLKRELPKKAVEEFERARQERLRGEGDSARQRLEKLLNQQPDFYDARNVLGSIYLEKKRFRDAEIQFSKARDLRSRSAAPLVSLGSLYVLEAEESLHPGPDVVGVVVSDDNLGLILDDARNSLEEAIKIKPDASFAYYLLGVVYTRNKDYPKAEQNLRKALELESQLRWAHLALANLYMKKGNLKGAIDEFDAYLAQYKKVSNRGEIQEARNKLAMLLGTSAK
jgi:tetratricopeptide (TPR) repeat protein